eukprot:3413769-Prorocentrum_lima.AAC.1
MMPGHNSLLATVIGSELLKMIVMIISATGSYVFTKIAMCHDGHSREDRQSLSCGSLTTGKHMNMFPVWA